MARNAVKVAILGGGCGAISAAFWLTNTAQLRQRFEVTVFTHGWRLGGKGASGRNASSHQRIEEHGLHMFMGFYENAFETLKLAYAELENKWDNRFKRVNQAFSPLRKIALMEQIPGRPPPGWEPWEFEFPRLSGDPGDGISVPIGWKVLQVIAGWLKQLIYSYRDSDLAALTSDVDAVVSSANKLASVRNQADINQFVADVETLRQSVRRSSPQILIRLNGYRLTVLVELGTALLRGLALDVLPKGDPNGFDFIDPYDFKDWLCTNGLKSRYAWSAPLRAIYDLAFAYEDGNFGSETSARIAAGAALKAFLKMSIYYKDAPLWKMNAGMGDVVFAPLYKALCNRGVTFNFFHRVQDVIPSDVTPSSPGQLVEQINLTRQTDFDVGYDPLITVKRLYCWPSQPKWPPKGAKKGRKKLIEMNCDLESVHCRDQVGTVHLKYPGDFDVVVLGIPPPSLEWMGRSLLNKSSKIRAMFMNTAGVPTQSVQFWRSNRAAPPFDPTAELISTFAEPFSSWALMSHLLPAEDWGNSVKSCEYYCGTMEPLMSVLPIDSGGYAEEENDAVQRGFEQWIATQNPQPRKTPKPVASFYHANFDPSELYIQTLPGSVAGRLAPDESAIDNLYFAGDWTKTSINGGSAEAAFESGRSAAEAIIKKWG